MRSCAWARALCMTRASHRRRGTAVRCGTGIFGASTTTSHLFGFPPLGVVHAARHSSKPWRPAPATAPHRLEPKPFSTRDHQRRAFRHPRRFLPLPHSWCSAPPPLPLILHPPPPRAASSTRRYERGATLHHTAPSLTTPAVFAALPRRSRPCWRSRCACACVCVCVCFAAFSLCVRQQFLPLARRRVCPGTVRVGSRLPVSSGSLFSWFSSRLFGVSFPVLDVRASWCVTPPVFLSY